MNIFLAVYAKKDNAKNAKYMNHIIIQNNQCIPLAALPVLDYEKFMEHNISLLGESSNHCVNYYGFPFQGKIRLICCIANDNEGAIYVSSSQADANQSLPSFTRHRLAFEKFEREIHENFGIKYTDHPWLKPVRYPFNRNDRNSDIANYPFFKIASEELHEVGVGPIHAGVIEPGHFRFICNGEQILHLEIQLGFQHRGIENLFLQKKKLLQRITLAESIAGDTVAGHTTAFVNLWESLCNYKADDDLQFIRTLALELERIAIHTGDMSALCTDIAYQLGSSVYGRLRTPIINYFQIWCGNRLAKGLIRAGKNNFPFTEKLRDDLLALLDDYLPDFIEMNREISTLASVLARFERTGVVTNEQAASIGTVGMAARTSGVSRDIRASHPHDLYPQLQHQPVIKHHGDVYSRFQIRREEVKQSIAYIKKLLEHIPAEKRERPALTLPQQNSFSISLVEGWRGEICHCGVTDENGELFHYKIKDPSFHNWLALALAVRNNEISDFPICNKSFDLSYCGHDL
ncbi:MAG TPA: NADH-quinone oxidoreductase subunit C [Chitinophagales bacterium]|nr:NADH-quinone oxidoreductase subunit C [Chitinophagales bacterium]